MKSPLSTGKSFTNTHTYIYKISSDTVIYRFSAAMVISSGSPAFFREKPTAPEDFRPSFRLELQKIKYRVPRETPRTTIGRRENSHVTPYKLGGEALGFLQQEKKERSGKKNNHGNGKSISSMVSQQPPW